MNVVNQTAYLRTSREFPEELHQLTVEVNKTYVDTAAAVNLRTIGIFPTNRPAITGESWFIDNQRQQTFRQIYPFTGATLTIDHGINFLNVNAFTRIYGTALIGVNWLPLPFVDVTAVANQIGIIVTPTQILITGATAATIVKGFIVLEWLSNI